MILFLSIYTLSWSPRCSRSMSCLWSSPFCNRSLVFGPPSRPSRLPGSLFLQPSLTTSPLRPHRCGLASAASLPLPRLVSTLHRLLQRFTLPSRLQTRSRNLASCDSEHAPTRVSRRVDHVSDFRTRVDRMFDTTRKVPERLRAS